MDAKFDRIGVDYANLRRPDPRIATVIHQPLGEARSVLNVGAGAGNYEPEDRDLIALEPSATMIRQRPASSASVVQGRAEALPFTDDSFDAVMVSLSVHHWSDQALGLRELRRVSRGPVVILTFDPACRRFWLADYVPELVALDEDQMPPMEVYAAHLGAVEIRPVPIPHDCRDGFLCAYWRRPAAYLDARIRKAISSFWVIGDVSDALARLEDDLRSGAWVQRYGPLLDQDAMDFGYRLVVARA
jgi:SAM-dependent methyltransferase